MYVLRVSLTDRTDDQIVDLGELNREQAEAFAAELRHEVEQAQDIDSPLVQMTVPEGGPELVWDPSSIVAIDLQDRQTETPEARP